MVGRGFCVIMLALRGELFIADGGGALGRYLVLVVLLSILSGCSQFFLQPQSVNQAEFYARLEQMTSEGRPEATSQLLREGRMAWQAGNDGESLQKLGRALRISPDDGLIYFYLASIKGNSGNPEEAASLARRGLYFAKNPSLQNQLRKLLSDIESKSLGD